MLSQSGDARTSSARNVQTAGPGGEGKHEASRSGSAAAAAAAAADQSPLERANVFSRLVFAWMTAIFSAGRKAPLEEEDLFPLPRRERTATTAGRVDEAFADERADMERRGTPAGPATPVRTGRVLRRVFGYHFGWAGALKFVNDLLGFAVPIQLNLILEFLADEDGEEYADSRGFTLACTLLATGVIKSLVENKYFFEVTRVSIQTRTAVSSMVYNKSLRLSSGARGLSTTGEIVNLMQLDAERLAQLVLQLHVLWSGAVQIVGYMTLLYIYIGPSALAGVACMPLLVMIQGVLVKRLQALRIRQVVVTDQRVKTTNEAVQGIRAIKMYAWTDAFVERIQKLRTDVELVVLRETALFRALNFAIISVSPTIVLVVTFFFYTVVAGEDMTSAEVFTAVAVFDRLRFPLIFYPSVIGQYVEAQVSLARLTSFMNREEVDNRLEAEARHAAAASAARDESKAAAAAPATAAAVSLREASASTAATAGDVVVEGCTFSWGSADEAVLRDVSFRVPQGSLTAVIGPVGSGKSSLCEALLRELREHAGGRMRVPGRVAYVAQSAWILNSSLRENVIFGHAADERRYQDVLRASQLRKDLELLPDGDRTEIGERGINLSGGQRQRVSVARAAYTDADLYVFDDPLSALDAEVGRRLFEQCVAGLLRGKTRIMVTNQLHFLQQADQVIVLDTREENGRAVGYVKEIGSFDALMSAGLDFAALMRKHGGEGDDDDGDGDGDEESAAAGDAADDAADASGDDNDDGQPRKRRSSVSRRGEVSSSAGVKKAPPPAKELVTSEERNTGAVKGEVYKRYALGAGPLYVAAGIIALYALYQVFLLGSSLWMAEWTQRSEDAGTSSPDPGLFFWLGVYTLIALATAVAAFARQYTMLLAALRSSTRMHERLLGSVLGATTQFFDQAPIGRIVARFSKDIDMVDNALALQLHFTLFSILNILVTLLVIVGVTPLFTAMLVPLCFVYAFIMNFYRASSREMKRMDSITRSPVYAHFSATLGGLQTIRAYGVQRRFVGEYERRVNRNHRATFALAMGDRWLALRLEMVGECIVFGAALFAVLRRGSIEPSLAGLSLTYAMAVTSLLGWAVRSFAGLENSMNSVERIHFYTDNIDHESQRLVALPGARALPASAADEEEEEDLEAGAAAARRAPAADGEAAWEDDAGRPGVGGDGVPREWPPRGEVRFEGLKVRYRAELDLVLRGITATIRAGEKIGVVGRTGSGKSTLMLTLLRMVEAAEGRIVVDGLDLAGVPLRKLRSRVSIIPQEPVLFGGTLRFNLDPLGEASDDALWAALGKVNLRQAVEEKDGGLDAEIAEYGENWSAGQRQLLCLARAVLRNSRVILLDEASSSLDSETDALIQETIRSHFEHSTVITIAHRLGTIIDSDRIMVLSDGLLVEFDHPGALVSRPDSLFGDMIDHLGESASQALRKVAVDRYAAAGLARAEV